MAMKLINSNVKVLAGGYELNCVYATPQVIPSTPLPLVISCHGSGEAGTNISLLYNNGLPNVLQAGYQPPFDFIMAAPQATSYGINADWMPYILADILTRYNIDKTRIYITGYSAGGWATYGSIMNEALPFGNNFAAIAPLSAATQDLTMSGVSNFKSAPVPVWAVAGSLDTSYLQNNEALVANINAVVPNLAVCYAYAGQGHGGWTNIYNTTYLDPNGKSIWDFLYSHQLGGTVITPAPTLTGATPTPATAGTTITLTGTNLTGATLVSFGGVPASSFTVVNPTTITAILGNGASGSIVVVTNGGTATLTRYYF